MCLYVEIFICYKKAHLPSLKLQRCWFSEERSSNSKHLIEVGSADANVGGTLIAASCMLNAHLKLCGYYGCDYKRGNYPKLSPNHFIVSPRFLRFLSFRLPQGRWHFNISETNLWLLYYQSQWSAIGRASLLSIFLLYYLNTFFRGIWWNLSGIWFDCSKEGMTHWPLSLRAVWSRIQPAIRYNSRGLSTSTRTSVTCFVKLGGGSWGRNYLNNTLLEKWTVLIEKLIQKHSDPGRYRWDCPDQLYPQKMTHAYIQVPLQLWSLSVGGIKVTWAKKSPLGGGRGGWMGSIKHQRNTVDVVCFLFPTNDFLVTLSD